MGATLPHMVIKEKGLGDVAETVGIKKKILENPVSLINAINHPATKWGGPSYAMQVSEFWPLISPAPVPHSIKNVT